MGKMKLYYWPSYRSTRCIWLIKELGVEDEFEFVRLEPHGPDKKGLEEYVKNVHPHGQIPGLEIEGRNPIIESGAICMYLANKYGKLGPDEDTMADYYMWILYAVATLDTILTSFLTYWILEPSKHDEATVEKTREKWNASLDFLTKTLSDGRDFICGSKFTAADCVLGYCLSWADFMKQGNLFQKHPVVADYLKRLQSRKTYQEAMTYA